MRIKLVRSLSPLLFVVGCGTAQAARPVTGPPQQTQEVAPRPLVAGPTTAALAACDPRTPDGRIVHRYVATLETGQRVRLSLHSDAFDPMLAVDGPDGFQRNNDDGFPGSLDSFLSFTAPSGGPYVFRATSLVAGQIGAYVLRAEIPAPPLGPTLPIGAPLDAQLGPPGALPGSWFQFEAQGGSWVRLRVTSQAFDTVATVFGPSGESWFNDDGNELGPNGTERPL